MRRCPYRRLLQSAALLYVRLFRKHLCGQGFRRNNAQCIKNVCRHVRATLDPRGHVMRNVSLMLLMHWEASAYQSHKARSSAVTETPNDAGSQLVHKRTAKCNKQLQQYTLCIQLTLNTPYVFLPQSGIHIQHHKTMALLLLLLTQLFYDPLTGTTQVSRYQKDKPFWILLKQTWWDASGISWTIWKLFALRWRR